MTAQTTRNRYPRNIREAVSRKVNEMLDTLLLKLEDNLVVAWLYTRDTLTVVVMALFVLSPMIVWPFLMGWPEPYCYVAYAIWISWIIGACILAAVVGYLREKGREK